MMDIKKMSVMDAIEYINNNDGRNYAFRGDDFIPVCKFRRSRYRGFEARKRVKLPGVSAIGVFGDDQGDIISSMCLARCYSERVFLLSFEGECKVGEDYGEIVLTNHRIIGIIDANFIRHPTIDNLWSVKIEKEYNQI